MLLSGLDLSVVVLGDEAALLLVRLTKLSASVGVVDGVGHLAVLGVLHKSLLHELSEVITRDADGVNSVRNGKTLENGHSMGNAGT